jgi:hypothetical protein
VPNLKLMLSPSYRLTKEDPQIYLGQPKANCDFVSSQDCERLYTHVCKEASYRFVVCTGKCIVQIRVQYQF